VEGAIRAEKALDNAKLDISKAAVKIIFAKTGSLEQYFKMSSEEFMLTHYRAARKTGSSR
jgi:hypothetical protein